jgi:hypothetical protein
MKEIIAKSARKPQKDKKGTSENKREMTLRAK